MLPKNRFLTVILSMSILIPIFLIGALLLPGVQKHVINTQLHPWIAQANVDYIHITPFSVKLDNLSFEHADIKIHIDHLNSKFSPFALLRQRIKIEQLVLEQLNIIDGSSRKQGQNSDRSPDKSELFFPGLFPYLNSGYIYDIEQLNIHINYHSQATGQLRLAVAGQSIDEHNHNPLTIELKAEELENIPDINAIFANATIKLNQNSNHAINSQRTEAEITLVDKAGKQQFLDIQVNMKQLAAPEVWAEFPFDKRYAHYLKKVLNPEHIQIHVKHTNQAQKVLAELQFDGQYEGNEGTISGKTELKTDKAFLKTFKGLKLPGIDSQLQANFRYNTRTLEGNIDLIDQLKVTDFAFSDKTSLPEQIDLANRLTASLNDRQLLINRFYLNLFSQGQEYVNIVTHKPLAINLNHLSSFLQQQQTDLLSIHINQLPLNWFSDFVPEHRIDNGILDTDINLSLAQNTLTLKSVRPLNIREFNLSSQVSGPNDSSGNEKISLLSRQNLSVDFNLKLNQDNLSVQIDQLDLYDSNERQKHNQLSASLSFVLAQPLTEEYINNPVSLKSEGQFNINKLIQVPVLGTLINKEFPESLAQSLPQPLALKYDLSVQRKTFQWMLEQVQLKLIESQDNAILSITNNQTIELEQKQKNVTLKTQGKLLSAQIDQLDLNWISPIIKRYANPYSLTGTLNKMDASLSAEEDNTLIVDIEKLKFSKLKALEGERLLFKDLLVNSNIHGQYANEILHINYPVLNIKQNKRTLLENSGSITLTHAGDKQKQSISSTGQLKADIRHIAALNIASQYTRHQLNQPSLFNGKYKIRLNRQQLHIKQSELHVIHPKSKGKLDIKTHKPIVISLQDNNYNFSQDGHLSVRLSNFDIAPYDSFFADIPISFKHANGHIDLLQNNNHQSITLKKPIRVHQFQYKDATKKLLNPFDLTLDFSINQTKNITEGEILACSVSFPDKTEQAFDLTARFKLNLDNPQPLSELNSKLNLSLTQWLSQPGIIPGNMLQKGTMTADISLNKQQKLVHQWLIRDLIDQQDKKIVESITIDGKGELQNLSNLKLELPIVMKSLSGTSHLDLLTHIKRQDKKTLLDMKLNGKEIFLNDLLKLLATINPDSELSQMEKEPDQTPEPSSEKSNEEASAQTTMDKTPAISPFWPTGIHINSQLNIEKLYYSDYMSYHDITGKLIMDDQQLQAENFAINFHDSPMKLNALFQFQAGQERPYDIDLTTTIEHFRVGEFLQALDPSHTPRTVGAYDVAIEIYGDLSNLSQIRNELLFNLDIEGENGVYHLIPPHDAMLRTSGNAMAVVGEVVSILPTAGFGLGIINRVVRFAKEINYDYIKLKMFRKNDMNTKIEQFRILGPEIHLFAQGKISFKENTQLFYQPVDMQAQLNLAGEGAAIFYGLGLLEKKQDEFGFWSGPEIKFWGSIMKLQDNFSEVINQAKEGTLKGGITNPFSGLVGNYRYRWFGNKPDYSSVIQGVQSSPSKNLVKPIKEQEPTNQENNRHDSQNPSFFDENFH